jgi:hypothetical protein
MAFDSRMCVRPLTLEELDELRADPEMLSIVQKTSEAIRVTNARMPQN